MTTANKAAANMRIALMRFGLGPKQGTKLVAANASSAIEACLKELNNPQAVQIPDSEMMVDTSFPIGPPCSAHPRELRVFR